VVSAGDALKEILKSDKLELLKTKKFAELKELYNSTIGSLGEEEDDEAEIVNAYCRYRLRFATDKDIKPLLKADFGISEKAFRQLKKRNMDKIDDKLNIL
jgi:hypothetical protein